MRFQPGFQFSLRSLLLAVVVITIGIFNWRILVGLSFGYFYPIAGLLLIITWWSGQRLRSPATDGDSRHRPFSILRLGVAMAFLACLLSVWVRYRWITLLQDSGAPRAFPYPDELLILYHNWLDAKYPAPAGSFKIHGEYYRVWRDLNATALLMVALLGGMTGLACRTTGPLGISTWRDRIVRAYRKVTSRRDRSQP